MNRAYYSDPIDTFLGRSPEEVIGVIALNTTFAVEATQRDAWLAQIEILRRVLSPYRGRGKVYFEYSVPRLGKRIDVVAIIDQVLFVIEFKVGEREFVAHARDQVWDYALDLKNFHETSHACVIAPVLVATRADGRALSARVERQADGTLLPMNASPATLGDVIARTLASSAGAAIDPGQWEQGRYSPTPTIIEAAMALYAGHGVAEISRRDASAINLTQTSESLADVIRVAREKSRKCVCFVTGVPGAGKTLVGLNIATQHIDKSSDLYSVFLSGNGPLVAILREALTRDRVEREKARGRKIKKRARPRARSSSLSRTSTTSATSASSIRRGRRSSTWRCSTRRSGRGTRNRPPSSCDRKNSGRTLTSRSHSS